MRQIKFRVWDKITKRMYYKVKIDWNGVWFYNDDKKSSDENYEGYSPWSSELIKLMQYTGLKDRNGKEIYEGDIIKVIKDEINEEYEYYEVIWSDADPIWCAPEAKFTLERACCTRYHDGGAFPQPEVMEVVGNIFENPELLPLLNPKEDGDETR